MLDGFLEAQIFKSLKQSFLRIVSLFHASPFAVFVLDHCPLQFRATASLIPSIIFVYGLHYPTLPLSTGEHHPSLNNRSRLNVSVSSLLKIPGALNTN